MSERQSARAARRRSRRRKTAAIGVGIAVVAAGGATALAATSGDGDPLITGAVTTGSVTQTIEASGAVASSSTTTASFAASGTVATVKVKVGQKVNKGQTLATLDTTALQSKLDSASASVATAEQKLQDDEEGVTSSTTASSGSGASGGSSSTTTQSASDMQLGGATLTAAVTAIASGRSSSSSPPSAPPSSASSSPSSSSSPSTPGPTNSSNATQAISAVTSAQQAVDADQAAVDTAQKTLDADVAQNTTLRDAATTACGALTTASTPTQACIDAQTAYNASADKLATDTAALDSAVAAQDAAITTLNSAISTLDTVIASLSSSSSNGSSSGKSTGSSTGGSSKKSIPTTGAPKSTSSGKGSTSAKGNSPAPSNGSNGSGSSSSKQSSTTAQPASASQLSADQASIDSAKAQLTVAKQNLAAATLKAPVSGKIASVGIVVGGGSGSSGITILGTGHQVVQVQVPISEIDEVKVGQPVSVVVDGRTDPITAKVSKIGLLSSTTGSLTTFPVTVTFDTDATVVHDGVGAGVTITTGSASNAVLVPNSAVTTLGTLHTVTVVDGATRKMTRVTIGLIGTDVSQVTSGLKAGQSVELADPKQALPSSATSSTGSRFGNLGPNAIRQLIGGFTGGGGGFARARSSG